MHTMIERVLKLKNAITFMFEEEFWNQSLANQETMLESYHFSQDDFACLADILHILMPLRDAQKVLEGEIYVNISLYYWSCMNFA